MEFQRKLHGHVEHHERDVPGSGAMLSEVRQDGELHLYPDGRDAVLGEVRPQPDGRGTR